MGCLHLAQKWEEVTNGTRRVHRVKGGDVMIITRYRKLNTGRVSVDYLDGGISGTLYADNYGELYRATRFLTLRHLDKTGISLILADKHGEEEVEE